MSTETKEAPRGPQQQSPRPTPKADAWGDLDEQIQYLRSKGWRCRGDARWPTAQWIDPTKPPKEETRMEPIFGRNQMGKLHRIIAPTGEPGQKQEASRLVVIPAVTPVTLAQALETQLLRDEQERETKAAKQPQTAAAAA